MVEVEELPDKKISNFQTSNIKHRTRNLTPQTSNRECSSKTILNLHSIWIIRIRSNISGEGFSFRSIAEQIGFILPAIPSVFNRKQQKHMLNRNWTSGRAWA